MAEHNRVLVPLPGKIGEIRDRLLHDGLSDLQRESSTSKGASSYGIVSGRAAALGVVNEDSEEMLFRLAMAGSVNRVSAQPRVAGIVSAVVEDEIALQGYEFLFLNPGCVKETLVRFSPDVIVIQRSQLHTGPWFGAESTTATSLSEQVIAMTEYAADQQIPCYIVDSSIAKDCNTRSLTQRASLIFTSEPSQFDDTEGASSSRLFRLLKNVASEDEH